MQAVFLVKITVEVMVHVSNVLLERINHHVEYIHTASSALTENQPYKLDLEVFLIALVCYYFTVITNE